MTSMTEEGTVLLRLHKVLATVFPPKKREYVQINIIDPNPIARGPWLSEIYSCMIENRETGETMFIVAKVVPLSEYIAKYGNVYRNEVHFYSVIFPNLKEFQKRKRVGNPFVNIPRYFGERLTTREEFLALEDVRKDGYELFDKTRCLTSQHLNMIFQTYARFHALSFVYKYEHPEDFSRMTSGLVDITQMAYKQTPIRFIDEAYRTAINAFNLETEADIIEKLNKIENVKDTLTKVQKYHGNYSCLIHGDCWTINNMLFKYKKSGELENVKLIDFQLVFVSTPVLDLSYFFYSGAEKADMDKLDYYLELYYDSFSSFVTELGGNPQEIYPFEALKEEWMKYSLSGLIIGIGMWVGKLLDKNELFSLVDRQGLPREKYFELWNAKLSEVRKGNTFRQRARDICLHAVEYGIL